MHIREIRQIKCEWWQWRCSADAVQCQFKVIICNVYDWQQNVKGVTRFQYKHIRICYLKEEATHIYHQHHEGSVPVSSGCRPHLGLYPARDLHCGLPPLPRHPPPRQLPGHHVQVQGRFLSHPGGFDNLSVCSHYSRNISVESLTLRTAHPAPTATTSARAWRTTLSASVSGQGGASDASAMWCGGSGGLLPGG